jgi:tight adherence protein B
MSALLGLALGAGLLLVASPWLWPRGSGAVARPLRAGRMTELLAQAGLGRVRPGVVIAVSGVLGAAVASLVLALLPVVPLALAAGIAAAALPWRVVVSRAARQRMRGRTVWPDVVDQLVSAVRSGKPLPDAMATLSTVGPEITREAFAEFAALHRRTGDFSGALDDLKARLADPVADRIAEAARLAREVGGSELTTVLRTLGATLRREAALRAEVEARQGWIANAARLGVAAPWVVLVVLSTRPEAAAAYNTPTGAVLVVGGLALSVVAYRVMLRVGRIPPERRWFA